jgi:hypothetical protein
MGSGSAHSRFLQQPRDLIFRLPKSAYGRRDLSPWPAKVIARVWDYRCGQKKKMYRCTWGWNHGSSGEGVFLDYPDKRSLRGP